MYDALNLGQDQDIFLMKHQLLTIIHQDDAYIVYLGLLSIWLAIVIGCFRNSQSDVIFAHAHIRGRQRFVQLYGICVKCGYIF